jgi:hypothetical protein
MACGQGGDDCCEHVWQGNLTEFERKANAGDEDAMNNLSRYYSGKIPGYNTTKSKLAVAQGDAAEKARFWAEKSINAGNGAMLPDYISNYIDISRDKTLPMAERRRSLVQALWTWQRVSPDVNKGKYWQRFSNEIPEKTDRSKGEFSQHDLHDIIFAMRDLDNEEAEVQAK